jgi:hypothetical protein
MKRAITLSAAVTAVALLIPNMSQAKSLASTDSKNTPTDQSAQAGTLAMVSARVSLSQNLDAKQSKAGDQIRTRLSNTVSLKNGPKLPRGTEILGVIADNTMQAGGTSKLTLSFTQAKLKDGTVVPIMATIVGVYPPATEDAAGHPIAAGDQVRDTFSGNRETVDQMDAVPGVDLHSNFASDVSGVLVSAKHNVKLGQGSEIALAIAPTGASPQVPTSSN